MKKYLHIYEKLRDAIVRGEYPYGARLPSKRTLSADFGCSVITIEHAYNLLLDEGYVRSLERSGFYAAFRTEEMFPVAAGYDGEEKRAPDAGHAPDSAAHSAESAADPTFPYGVLARTMRRVITTREKQLLEKAPNTGCAELREALAAYLGRSRALRVSPGQIVIGSGAEYLYALVVEMLGTERIYALEDPSYSKIRRVYEANGASCELLPLGPDGIPVPELERSQASVLHVTPFHSYPSGVTASASRRREYVRWAVRRGGYVVEDDFDSEFSSLTKPEDTLFSLEPERTVIYMNTFSHTIAPSMRLGYMVLPPAILPLFRETVGFYSCTVPVFEQYLVTELLNSGDFERHINRVRRKRRLWNEQ